MGGDLVDETRWVAFGPSMPLASGGLCDGRLRAQRIALDDKPTQPTYGCRWAITDKT